MKCPECKHDGLMVTNTYSIGDCEKSQRTECPKCGAVTVLLTKLVSINPSRGQGAAAIAKRLNQKR